MRILFLTLLYYTFALSSFVNPYYGVIGYTFISIIRPEQLTWGNSSIKNVFAVAIISLFISCVVKREKLLLTIKQPLFICFILLISGFYLSTLTSNFTVFSEQRGGLYYLSQLPQIICFCICLYAVLSRLDSSQLQRYIVITLSFITFMGVWGIDQNLRGNIGVEGLFGYDRNAVTSVFVMYLPIAFFFAKKQKSYQKLIGIIGMLVCFSLVILTQSRAGFLGLTMVILFMFWCSRNKVLFLGWILILLLLGVIIAPDGYFDRFSTMQTKDITGNDITDYSSASRLLMWNVALKMIADHPVLGVGYLNFSKANKIYAASFEGKVDQRLYNTTFGFEGQPGLSHTHNTFLNVLVEGGLVSAVPFYMMFLMVLRNGMKLTTKYHARHDDQLELLKLINCGIAGFLATAFFSNLILVDYFYWNLTISSFLSQRLEANLKLSSI